MNERVRAFVALTVVVGSSALSGCTPVPAWSRGKLAHPTMKPGSSIGTAESHVHSIQEGAIGGAEGEGSGCGCN